MTRTEMKDLKIGSIYCDRIKAVVGEDLLIDTIEFVYELYEELKKSHSCAEPLIRGKVSINHIINGIEILFPILEEDVFYLNNSTIVFVGRGDREINPNARREDILEIDAHLGYVD